MTNTDSMALDYFLSGLKSGPVVVLGGGGVAKTSLSTSQKRGWSTLMHTRRNPCALADITHLAPTGIIHATPLGMAEDDPLPFPEVLEAALPTLRWAVEWVNNDKTAFNAWAEAAKLKRITGAELFEKQAELQSKIFIGECGGGERAE
jgi:shikimate 5-dehydrogenase